MRVGNNPSNEEIIEDVVAFHRVIIPVYIPSETDYFKDAFEIFNYCLRSLHKTSCTHLKVSVVSNGSCTSVNEKLFGLQKEGYIDELMIETEGIGKINSVLKVLRTADERLITITDADVLFDNGWEEAVTTVFKEFPKAGSVCPVPVFRKNFSLTGNVWFSYLFSKKLKFLAVENPEAMTRFANSIGWSRLDAKFKEVIATLKLKNGATALVGCAHFVATYKNEVFTEMPKGNSRYKIRGDSELLYTDLPVLKKGGHRLSTSNNYAYHMGNVLEAWMVEKFEGLDEETKRNNRPQLKELKKPLISHLFIDKLFKNLISFAPVKKSILKMKGLTSAQIKEFPG